MNIRESAIIVKTNQTYREDMSVRELYEIVRGIWKIDKRKRDRIQYVLAAANGYIKEVYKVDLLTSFATNTLGLHSSLIR